MQRLLPATEQRPAQVLTRATLAAARALGLSQKDLAGVLGVSEASVSRLGRGRSIDPELKDGELALLLVRVFRSLDALVGGDPAQVRAWMQAHHRHLGATPGELVGSVTGLVRVVEYLDGLRGKS